MSTTEIHGARRRVNDVIWQSFDDADDPVAFFCECGRRECYRAVWLKPTEYERRRVEASWLALAQGHHRPAPTLTPDG
ncbi:MAG TPA: hypothetical protein VE088_05165 [Gaiellaceae bacterium]|nr:hypothetical protein [Gaiellaceae bacterium]